MFQDCVRHFLFYILSVVSGVSVLCLLDFPWGLSLLFEFRFFSSAFASYSQFNFLLSYSGMLASSCFPRIFWVSLNLWGLLFLRFRLWLHLFFALWSSLFRMLRFGLLAVFLSVFFHMLWLRVIVSVLPPRFSTCCGFGCPFLFLSPFSVCCDSSCSIWSSYRFFRILRLRLLFDFGTPPVVVCAAGSPLAVPRLSGCCFPCVSANFLLSGFLRLLRFSSLSLGQRSLPWCMFLLVLVVVFFTPALDLSPLVLPCSVAVALWLSVFWLVRISGSRRDVVSFGTSQFGFGLCILVFELPAYAGILSVLSPLHSSALFASGILLVSCSPSGLHLFSLVLSIVRCWFFPETFLVPTRSCSFLPSSGSSLISFRCSSLRSLLPFSSRFFCCYPSSPLFS